MIKLENVSYRYASANRNALTNVTCTLADGTLTAIIGPSGSGKTTLLSILAGLDKPTEGSVHIDEQNYSDLDLDRCRREQVAMIFQAFQLFPLLTAEENVSFAMEINGAKKPDAKAYAHELLDMVGIGEDKYRRYPANLSGGEKQRVAIARSLASGAKVILADEPTGALDTANTENIMDILKFLAHDKGYCVIVVTHDLEVASAADCVLRLVDGELYSE